jgi:hypothetical protein
MDLCTHLVAIPANGRAQVEEEILRHTPEFIAQELDPPFQDSSYRAPPSSMEKANGPHPRIRQENGHTIRHRHPQQDPP